MRHRVLVIAVLVIGSMGLLREARAEGEDAGVPGGLVLEASGLERMLAVPQVATRIDLRVTGPVARTTVSQSFDNPSRHWVEGRYVFPLPDDAAVDRMVAHVAGRVIEGEVQEKQQAKETYDKARAEGRQAGLVEQIRPNVFELSMANIAPHAAIAVEMEYQSPVSREGDRFELRVPLVVAPRFHPLNRPEIVSDARLGTEEPRPAGELPVPTLTRPEAWGTGNPVVFDILLDPGFPIAGVKSPSHEIAKVQRLEDGRTRVTLAGDAVPADRDFVLTWRAEPGAAPEAAAFTETVDGKTYYLVTALPARAEDRGEAPPRELILVIDTSGSMQGASIDQARRALKVALSRLRPEDRFNLIRFDDQTAKLFPKAVAATPEVIGMARAYVDHLDAGGGTQIVPALRAALDGTAPAGTKRQVVFITDGAVANERGFIDLLNDRVGENRLYMVGIGSAPNSWLMRKAAEVGRGARIFIGGIPEIETRMTDLFRKLERPALTDVTVAWPDGLAVETHPARVPDLHDGDQLVLAARVDGTADTLTLSGMSDGAAWFAELDLAAARTAPGIGKLWARERIEALEDSLRLGADRVRVRQEIVALAIAHRLASRHTSFVAVDRTPVRPEDKALLERDIPANLPAGWERTEATPLGGAGLLRRNPSVQPIGMVSKVAIGMPRTATPASLKLLVGLATLLLAIVLCVVARRMQRRALPGLGGWR